MRFTRIFAILSLVVLSACAKQVYAPDIEVQQKSYVHGGQPSLTLLTMISNSSGAGGHSALMINGSQRVMYDPAGRFKTTAVAERNDLLFGITPQVLKIYNSFHARDTHHVLIQEIPVSAEIAEIAIREAMAQGASHDAMCASNTSALLSRLPGFESVGTTLFPVALTKKFGALAGVKTSRYYENDAGQNYQ